MKRPGEASAYIPHVSFLSLKNRVEDAYDVLHKISALKEQRNRLFNRAGATDFKTYHMSKKVQSGELPRLKRTIVIIDEYQNMLEATGNGSAALAAKCSARLLALLKEIRNAGISIILSSQAICVGREAKDQIFNRIVFSGSENTINSAFETSRSGEMMTDLQQERGLAYQSEDGGVHATLFKAAWAGKTNGAEHQRIAKEIFPATKHHLWWGRGTTICAGACCRSRGIPGINWCWGSPFCPMSRWDWSCPAAPSPAM